MERFKIVIPAYNAMPWLKRCLEMVERQSYPHFDVCVVDDASTQPGQCDLIEEVCLRNGWKALFRSENGGPLQGTLSGIEALACDPEEIIVIIDGDDWLFSEESLQTVVKAYREEDVDLTYGQFIYYPTGRVGFGRMPDAEVVEERLYRSTQPLWCHLRTFRAFLWQAIDDADLRAPNGSYYRYAGDHAYMNPMLEMVGRRFKALEEVTYVYNRATPYNDDKVARVTQFANRTWIRSRPRYDVLERCTKR